MVGPLTFTLQKCVHLPYFANVSLLTKTWIAATDYGYVLLHNCAISIDSYSPDNKFCSFIIFSILINAVILPLNCLVLIIYLCIHFVSLRSYFISLNIIWSFI